MSNEPEIILTHEGVKELEETLEHLKSVRRPEIAEQLEHMDQYEIFIGFPKLVYTVHSVRKKE